MDPANYTPIYVEVDDIPIDIPDSYSLEQKKKALYQAESRFETERTGGKQISDADLTPTHKSAVINLGTYHLARGATDNEDVTLGDLDDGGEQTERHAEQFLETYKELVELISEAGDYGQPGTYFGATGDPGRTVAVNQYDETTRHTIRGTNTEIVDERYVSD